jgi:hypothetical protein
MRHDHTSTPMMSVSRRTAVRRTVAGIAAMATGGLSTALAQETTPTAVRPPQDLLPKDADYGTGTTAEINGVDIYYELYGEGDPVLLLHGGLATGDQWVSVIPRIAAAGYHVIVVDSRQSRARPLLVR